MIKVIKIKKIVPLSSNELEDKKGLYQVIELSDKPVRFHFNHLYNIQCEDLVQGVNYECDGEEGIIRPLQDLGGRKFKFTFNQRREQKYSVEMEVKGLPLRWPIGKSQLKNKESFKEFLKENKKMLEERAQERKKEEESEKEELLGEY